MLELETLLAFGVGAGLVALAPMVRRLGNHQLGESMTNAGKGMAKGGIKVGVTVATVASKAAQTMVSHASEATESFMDLVAEARTELQDATAAKQARDVSVVDVSPD